MYMSFQIVKYYENILLVTLLITKVWNASLSRSISPSLDRHRIELNRYCLLATEQVKEEEQGGGSGILVKLVHCKGSFLLLSRSSRVVSEQPPLPLVKASEHCSRFQLPLLSSESLTSPATLVSNTSSHPMSCLLLSSSPPPPPPPWSDTSVASSSVPL